MIAIPPRKKKPESKSPNGNGGTASKDQKKNKPSFYSDYCFGHEEGETQANKMVECIAFNIALTFLQGKSESCHANHIAKEVVHAWTTRGGRFVLQNGRNGLWVPLGPKLAVAMLQHTIDRWIKSDWAHELGEYNRKEQAAQEKEAQQQAAQQEKKAQQQVAQEKEAQAFLLRIAVSNKEPLEHVAAQEMKRHASRLALDVDSDTSSFS